MLQEGVLCESDKDSISGGAGNDLLAGESANDVISYVWTGSNLTSLSTQGTDTSGEITYTVPTLDGGMTAVKQSTAHLYDGVNKGAYRFLGVKRGTILISGSGSVVSEPQWVPVNSLLLKVPPLADLRIAGDAKVYHTSASFAALPTGGPKKLRGIAVDGGGDLVTD